MCQGLSLPWCPPTRPKGSSSCLPLPPRAGTTCAGHQTWHFYVGSTDPPPQLPSIVLQTVNVSLRGAWTAKATAQKRTLQTGGLSCVWPTEDQTEQKHREDSLIPQCSSPCSRYLWCLELPRLNLGSFCCCRGSHCSSYCKRRQPVQEVQCTGRKSLSPLLQGHSSYWPKRRSWFLL